MWYIHTKESLEALLLNCVHLYCNPTDCSLPVSLSMGFPRQEYWSGLPYPSPGDLLNPGMEIESPELAWGKPRINLFTLRNGLPGGSDGKESACSAWDLGWVPGSGRCLGEGNSYPLQFSCLDNSMDRGSWWATTHEVTRSWTWLGDFHFWILKRSHPWEHWVPQ